MQSYTEMKSAGSPWLDEVPAHWTVSRFRYEAAINGGQVDPREAPWSSMTLIAPNHIESNTGRVVSIESAEDQGADSGKYLVEQGQLVYSKIRPALNKAAIAETQALCSADMYAMSFRDRIEPLFALYYVLARPFHTFATVTSMRVKMPKVNREELAEAPWLVPPLDEQRAIADYLDRETTRIDRLTEEQQRLIEMLRERRSDLISHAVLGETSQRTQLRRLVDVIDCAHVTAEFVDDEDRFPVASIRECQGPTVDLSACAHTTVEFFEHLRSGNRAPRAGDLLFIRNVSVGLISVVTPDVPDFAMGQETVLLRRKSAVHPEFLRYALVGSEARHAIEGAMIGSTFRRINVSAIRALPVATPPIAEQRRIAAYLDEQTEKIDRLIAETERFIELSRERRTSLITAAVTGQIDVREVA